MYDDTLLIPVKEAIHAIPPWKTIVMIHVTNDFFMRVKAKCTPPIPDMQKEVFEYTILGFSVCEHIEYSKNDFWIEIEGELPEGHCGKCGKRWGQHPRNQVCR